jgi:serine/threonine-protein kinase
MSREEWFELAIQALLDGRSLAGSETPDENHSIDESLRVVDCIARASRLAIFGTDVPLDRSCAARWGHLEIRGEIGRGASGTVYRAWDTKLAREVALKLLAPEVSIAADALEEGRLLARLNHPHIVRVFGADTHDAVTGIWMELLEGDTLDDILERDGVFGPEDTLLIGLDLAGALSAVHAAGLLHRDVKARNVLRVRGGRLVLMDLGAGRAADTSLAGRVEKGTPLYMAPEVLTGGPATERSDIYSLGVLLYRLLTRTYPVIAGGLNGVRAAHAKGELVALDAARPGLPSSIVRVVARACHANAEARYASAAELEAGIAEAFYQAMAERTAVASAVMRRWARWRKSLAVASSTVLLSLLTLWASWDTSGGRAVRRRAGLNVAPRSPLYLAIEGGLGIVRARRTDVLPYNPTTATAIAVSADLGVRTMAGIAPWTTGGSFRLDGTPIAVPVAPSAAICCFSDGTTDGRFNYSVRQDSTLLEPIGSRALSPPALYQFERDWSKPQALFPLLPEGEYFGVAHSTAGDSFWLTRNTRNEGRIEHWSRQGALLSTRILVPWADLMGLALDPADNTLWVTRPGSSGVLRLENFDTAGRHLGSLDVPWPHPVWRPGGAEFAWTAAP